MWYFAMLSVFIFFPLFRFRQIVPLDQLPYLLDLIRFGEAAYRLKVNNLWYAFSIIDLMAAATSIETLDEAKPLDIPTKISKADIFVRLSAEQLSSKLIPLPHCGYCTMKQGPAQPRRAFLSMDPPTT